jgi:hypothetical protein
MGLKAGVTPCLFACAVLLLPAIVARMPVYADGIAFSQGDVFVGAPNGTIYHYSGAGNLLDTLNTGAPSGSTVTGMCFDAGANLYAINFGIDTISCNGLIISEAETDNIHLRRPTIIDNINRCEPTLFDNQPTLGDNSLITSLSTQIN